MKAIYSLLLVAMLQLISITGFAQPAEPTGQSFITQFDNVALPNNNQTLTGFYRGSNDGFYYVRQVGSEVFWFGEEGNGSWANVFHGELRGARITGGFFDVPKGSTTGRGELTFSVNSDCTVITKLSGGGSGLTYTRSALPSNLPQWLSAGFQQVGNINDLDGAWACNDGGRYYIREIEGMVIWFGESRFSNGRPVFSNVAIGDRNGNSISLRWADVPKGSLLGEGNLVLRVNSANEIIKVSGAGFGGSQWVRTCN